MPFDEHGITETGNRKKCYRTTKETKIHEKTGVVEFRISRLIPWLGCVRDPLSFVWKKRGKKRGRSSLFEPPGGVLSGRIQKGLVALEYYNELRPLFCPLFFCPHRIVPMNSGPPQGAFVSLGERDIHGVAKVGVNGGGIASSAFTPYAVAA